MEHGRTVDSAVQTQIKSKTIEFEIRTASTRHSVICIRNMNDRCNRRTMICTWTLENNNIIW
jgi:hypothetical protein